MKRICRVQGIAVCWSPDAVYYIPLNPAAPGVDKFVAGMMANKRAQKVTFDLKSQMVALLSGTLLHTSTELCANLYCTVLYRTMLYCTVLYCTVLYCTVLYCTVLYCTVLYCTVLYRNVMYSNKSYNGEHKGVPPELLHIIFGRAGLPEMLVLSCADCIYSGAVMS